ncbi:response regulator transcription factor [Streptomyces sulphureus]|uniref:response regulator transcription factor n=1 Tax=Streptomyces sulphureus TaxID=47758 RepID=UPI00099681F3|nr:response regulator transcription factor [Streptomyces sulphureus]
MTSRIAIAGKSRLTVEMIAESLSRESGLDVVAVVSSYQRLVEAVEEHEADVALVDLERVHGSWARATDDIRRVHPGCGVALVLDTPSRTFVDQALRAGVLSIISRTAGLRRLIDSVHGVASGQVVIDPQLLSAGRPDGPLSDREADVLRLTASGASVKEMAGELYLSAGTIRNLASAAIRKLDARNRYDAVRIASEQCWI